MTQTETLDFLVDEGLVLRDMMGECRLLISGTDPTCWVRYWPKETLVCYGTWPPIPARDGEVIEYLMTGRLPRPAWED